MDSTTKDASSPENTGFKKKLLIVLLVPFGLAITVLLALLPVYLMMGIDLRYVTIFLNIASLGGCLYLVRLYKITRDELGLSLHRERFALHIFSLVLLVIFFAWLNFVYIGISTVNAFSFDMIYYFVNYIIVAIYEEVYFRGIVYSILCEKSSGTALIGSSVYFGLSHFRQGLLGITTKVFIGFGWGSVRYATSMIFILIIFHFVVNFFGEVFKTNTANMFVVNWLHAGLMFIAGGIILLYDHIIKKHRSDR